MDMREILRRVEAKYAGDVVAAEALAKVWSPEGIIPRNPSTAGGMLPPAQVGPPRPPVEISPARAELVARVGMPRRLVAASLPC